MIIEGAEFDVLQTIIDKQIYKHINYIICETHERFFVDGNAKMQHLHAQIEQNNITNIFLDWI